jgi:hypothetical protein
MKNEEFAAAQWKSQISKFKLQISNLDVKNLMPQNYFFQKLLGQFRNNY